MSPLLVTSWLNGNSPKESRRMFKRLLITAVALATVALTAASLPASSSAASPWWQVLDGSRPSSLWKPTDSVQEITATMEFEGVVQKLEVEGKTLGCLGSETPLGEGACPFFVGTPVIRNAAELEAALEPIYGSDVTVSGGPVGVNPLIVTVPGRSVPTIGGFITPKEAEEQEEARFGTATNKIISQGGSGRLVLTITNLGDEEVHAGSDPVTIIDKLPEGVVATGFEAIAGQRNANGPVDCEIEGGTKLNCTFENELPSYESIEIEVLVRLLGDPPVAGLPGEITVTGGGAPRASISQTIVVSPDKVPFGVERFSVAPEEEGGSEAKRAGSHPFQYTTTLQMNAGPLLPAAKRKDSAVEQPAQPRTFRFTLPAGVVGNISTVPKCSLAQFYDAHAQVLNQCPDDTAIGVAAVTIVEKTYLGFSRLALPLFNLEPTAGEPAKLGFTALGPTPVIIDTEVDPDNQYKLIATVRNTTQLAALLSSTVTIWGTPGDPRHNSARGWRCAFQFEDVGPCENPSGANEDAFLRLPVSCDSTSTSIVEVEPWNAAAGSIVGSASSSNPPVLGCNQVPFNPSISSSPTSKLASNPSGLDFRLDMPNHGLLSSVAIAEGQAKKIEVELPKGMTINPSQGEGLVGCSQTDLSRETFNSNPGVGCPEASKVGEVQISTPLIEEEARGSIYVASPYDNPFNSLLALYVVARIPERGVLVKQAGVLKPDPVTGQLVATFDDVPQLPISSLKAHFREGGRAPLVTPAACGRYDIVTRFVPWSAADPDNPTPGEVVTRVSSFEVERGADGGACPGGGKPPFHPDLFAGTVNNAAKSYSPFNLRLTRKDGEQEFTNFSIKLPPGVIGKLAGIDVCSDAAIAAAKARTGPNGGLEEIQSPSCPANSYVGRTLVGAGVGSSLTYVPGKIYLAGPFNGAPLSVVSITPARVGPFDLGTVVLRLALKVNPETAEVFVDPTGSDPIPHIIQGIPVHARDIRAYVDRPEFVLNPTSCERTSTASTVLGSGLDFGTSSDDEPVTVTSPFQAADCASLGFKPQLSLQLLGGTKRGDTPRLRAVLTPRKGDANIGRAQVTLPHSAFLEQAHIRTVCTRVQFKAGGGNGEQCPKGSIYGKASAITPLLGEPLNGKVFLRSSDNELPDLVAALHSSQIDFNLVGRLDSLNGRIRSTFDAPPDAPVTKFTLEMQGGQKGLIVNSTNICKGKHRAIATLKGQNGRLHEFKPVVKAKCGGKKAKKGKSRRR